MPISQYIENINKLYKTGNAREHSYRGDLQMNLQELSVGHRIILLQSGIFQLDI